MSAAKVYARALYETASSRGENADKIEDQLDSVTKLFTSTRDVEVALFSPIASAKEKTGVINDVSKKAGYSALLSEFLTLLARKERLALLPAIRDAFIEVRLEAEGGVVGKLVAAGAINEKDVKGLAEAFGRKLGKKVAFQVSTDDSLLAGMKVTVAGVTYDGTLRSQLQRLRDRLMVGLT
jgi:F-type H+-transporting ATPase subunit delta